MCLGVDEDGVAFFYVVLDGAVEVLRGIVGVGKGQGAQGRGQVAEHWHGNVVWVYDDIEVFVDVDELGDEGVRGGVCVVAVEEVALSLCLLEDFLVDDFVVVLKLDEKRAQGLCDYVIKHGAD